MSMPSVAVVIVNWNSGALLEQCLQHLAAQSRRPEQVFVMDNGSQDGSTVCAPRFPEATFFPMPANLGFAAGNNRAFALATTEYVALLNPDANAEPDWLQRLMEAAVANPDVATFASRQMLAGARNTVDGLGDVYHMSGLAWRKGYRRDLDPRDLAAHEVFAACGAAALYRRDALLQAGGFDEDYFCYGEDVDLGFRLRLAGHRCLLVPEAVVHHVGGATGGGVGSEFSLYHGHRNLVWTFFKDVPGLLFWLLLPVHVLQNLVMIPFFVLRGRGRVICRAKWDALRGIGRAWRKRRAIQARRVASVPEIWRAMDHSLLPWRRSPHPPGTGQAR